MKYYKHGKCEAVEEPDENQEDLEEEQEDKESYENLMEKYEESNYFYDNEYNNYLRNQMAMMELFEIFVDMSCLIYLVYR